MSGEEYVRRDGRVLRLSLSTNAMGSALDLRGRDAWVEALEPLIRGDTSIGAVLLTGGDKNFCAGGNVKAFAASQDPGATLSEMAGDFHQLVRALVRVPVPIVAGVRGFAAGGGMSAACAADISIGGPSTVLLPAYPQLGFSPDGGLTWLLPRLVGIGRAREILLTDRPVAAPEAHALGLLGRLVDSDDDVLAQAEALASRLAAGPTSAYRSIKRLLAASPSSSLDEILDAEQASISWSADSPAGREGVQAFVGKREPRWEGTDAVRQPTATARGPMQH